VPRRYARRGRQRLQVVGVHPFGVESFVKRFIGPGHFARVTLDAADDLAVPRLYRKQVVNGFESGTLEEFHRAHTDLYFEMNNWRYAIYFVNNGFKTTTLTLEKFLNIAVGCMNIPFLFE
jgi:hypothetical protein